MLHAFLFRSYFACLPWLVFYQIISLHTLLEQAHGPITLDAYIL